MGPKLVGQWTHGFVERMISDHLCEWQGQCCSPALVSAPLHHHARFAARCFAFTLCSRARCDSVSARCESPRARASPPRRRRASRESLGRAGRSPGRTPRPTGAPGAPRRSGPRGGPRGRRRPRKDASAEGNPRRGLGQTGPDETETRRRTTVAKRSRYGFQSQGQREESTCKESESSKPNLKDSSPAFLLRNGLRLPPELKRLAQGAGPGRSCALRTPCRRPPPPVQVQPTGDSAERARVRTTRPRSASAQRAAARARAGPRVDNRALIPADMHAHVQCSCKTSWGKATQYKPWSNACLTQLSVLP